MPPMTPQKRSVWPWILGIGAVLAFMGIGVVILIIVLASMGGNNNNNGNRMRIRTVTRTNRVDESQCKRSNANTNTRSTLASYTDDFSSEDLAHGLVKYGRTWYEDDEYHMKASTKAVTS